MPPAPFTIQYPMINGHRFSFRSLELIFNNIPMLGVKSVNWSDELMPGEIYGTAPQKLGDTRGKQKSTFDFEIYSLEWDLLRRTLGAGGQGFGETYWMFQGNFREVFAAIKKVVIIGIRVNKVESSNSEGDDGSFVKVTCSTSRVYEDGAAIAFAGAGFKIAF